MIERAPPVPPVSVPKPRRRRFLLFLGIFLSAVVALPVAAAGLAGIIIQANGWLAVRQPSSVMLPNMMVDDVYFVETRAYRDGPEPTYGDVVVVEVPGRVIDMSRIPTVLLAERIIGLPGDRVEVRDRIVSVNGRPLPQDRLGPFSHPARSADRLIRYREHGPHGVAYDILLSTGRPSPMDGTYSVPPGHYFVLGDNRDDSLDSRYWAKQGWFLPADKILGRVGFVYWSGLDRLDRIGTAVK